MANISATVILKTTDNIAANFCTNTYYFDVDEDTGAPGGDLESQTNTIALALKGLYESFSTRLSGLQATGHRIKFVDIDGPKPQYPYQENMFDIDTTLAPNQLPSECCIVSSFEAEQVAGVNQASRRGRVYIGPLADSAVDNAGRVTDAARSAIASGFNAFWDDQDGAGFSGWKWMVYSPTLDALAQVKMGHVDNAIDIQRRRGVAATFRSVWTG